MVLEQKSGEWDSRKGSSAFQWEGREKCKNTLEEMEEATVTGALRARTSDMGSEAGERGRGSLNVS